MLTPALSRNWQIVYSSMKDTGPGQQSIYGTGCLNGTFECIVRRAACGMNKKPAEQAAGACFMERFVEGAAEC
jgi:hypothetical protein